MKKHMQNHKNSAAKVDVFLCETCGKECNSAKHLSSHNRMHVPVDQRQTYQCYICKQNYLSRKGLKSHMALIHLTAKRKKFKCEICNTFFCSTCSLRRHSYIHSGLYPFECKICKKRFRGSDTLKVCIEIHQI